MAFEDEYEFKFITNKERVDEYLASHDVFQALLIEIKELSKKKPDAIMNAGKVKVINRVLENLLLVLKGQPDEKYLDTLDDDDLPQMSDAVLTMVQFQSALDSYKSRHYKWLDHEHQWITEEFVQELKDCYE